MNCSGRKIAENGRKISAENLVRRQLGKKKNPPGA